MDKDLTRDYLRRAGMPASQSEALARVMAQFATRDELHAVENRLRTEMLVIETRLRAEMQVMEQRLRADMHSMKSDMTRWFLTTIVLLATLTTVLDVFVD
jgi:hypothetical protein